jgi:replicative DNA helicase
MEINKIELGRKEIQDAALYSAMWGDAKRLFSIVSVEDFDYGAYQDLAAIIERGSLEYGDNLVMFAQQEAIRLGSPSPNFVGQIASAGFGGSVTYYAERLREMSVRRSTETAIMRAMQAITQNTDVSSYEIIDRLRDDLETVPQPLIMDDDTWTLNDLMSINLSEQPFTIPKMLRKNERLVLTGSEGGGKSVFVYQMLTGAAFGIDTFNLETHEPKRVLFIDVENNEVQARQNLDKIVPTLMEMAPDVKPEWRSMKRRVVNLIDSKDKADILRRVVHYNPDILYMGTAYKLTDITDETHRAVRAIQSTVDRIRQEVECTVIVEHHAGHGFQNDRNNMRPEGSSFWLRWPDFGYGMVPIMNNGGRLMRLQAWRGDRVTGRDFPAAVRQGSVFPWQSVSQDEWEAVYADKYDK